MLPTGMHNVVLCRTELNRVKQIKIEFGVAMNDTDVDFEAIVKGTRAATIRRKGIEVKTYQSLFVKSVDEEKRQITALASSGEIDRHGEIVKPSAFKKHIAGYMKNPVLLASHQHRLTDGRSPVVGSVVKAWIDKSGLWIVVEFAETELGKEYWLLYSKKHQRAFSIGFMPIKSEDEKIGDRTVRVFTEVELLEISCVAVPSNREALSRSAQRKAGFVAGKREEKVRGVYGEYLKSERLDRRYEVWQYTPKDKREQHKFTDEERTLFADRDEKSKEFAEALLRGGADLASGDSPDTEFVELVQEAMKGCGWVNEQESGNIIDWLWAIGVKIVGRGLYRLDGTPIRAESLPESKASDTEHDFAGIVSGTVKFKDTRQKSYSDLVGV